MSAFKDWLTGLTSKTTPVDADELYLRDSSGTPSSKKLTWANLKSAISSVQLGEIRYFADAPTDPSWLKCDGAAYLRSDYPAYEAMRPKSALKQDILYQQSTPYVGPSGGACWTGQYFISCGSDASNYSATRNLYRSTDAINWTLLENVLPASPANTVVFSFGTTGRVLAFNRISGECIVSLDHGATWSTASPTNMPTTATPTLNTSAYWTVPIMLSSGKILAFLVGADIAAISSDGVTWTKIQLPRAGFWEMIHDKYPQSSDVYAADSSTPGRYVEVYNDVFYSSSFWLPCAGMFNDWHGGSFAYGPAHYVCMSQSQKQMFVAETGGSYLHGQVMYDAPINVGNLSGVAFIDGRFIGRSGRDLLIFTAEDSNVEYVKNFFPSGVTDSVYDVSISKGGEVYMFGAGSGARIYHLTIDPTKFNAPGLPSKANTHPYVYTGA